MQNNESDVVNRISEKTLTALLCFFNINNDYGEIVGAADEQIFTRDELSSIF